MNWTEYQTAAQRTADTTQDDAIRRQLCALGLIGETGEVAELLKHAISHGEPVDIERLKLELGDVCWYVAEGMTLCGYHDCRVALAGGKPALAVAYLAGVAWDASMSARLIEQGRDVSHHLRDVLFGIAAFGNANGIAFADVLQANVDKLRKRHPQGFSVEASINRGAT